MASATRALLLLASVAARQQPAPRPRVGRVQADIQRALDRAARPRTGCRGRWARSPPSTSSRGAGASACSIARSLRWWQRALEPAIPHLIQLLADDSGLEWIDGNGMTEQVTTPRKEATLALVGLERAVGRPPHRRPRSLRADPQGRPGPAADRGPAARRRRPGELAALVAGPPGSSRCPGSTASSGRRRSPCSLLGGGLSLVIWRQRKAAAAA